MRPKPATKILALLLALYLVLSGLPLTVLAEDGAQSPGENSSNEAAAALPFSDVAADDSNLLYINYINAREIMAGFPDGSFRPEEGLTRAQAAVIIGKAANLEPGSAGESSFNDVSPQHWAAEYVAAAVQAGYLQGMGDGSYRPDQPLSRAQAISLIMRMSAQEDSRATLPALNDINEEHWAARSMAMAIDAGMIIPQNNNIRPDQNITRGDISRALAVLLTSDPELSSRPLSSTLQVKSGEVKVSRAGQEAVTLSGSRQVGAGDTIETLPGATAEINYPDGSSLLLKAGSVLTIKESVGRAYIKHNGQSGTAVDSLYLELQTGTMFGALSSLAAAGSTDAQATSSPASEAAQQVALKQGSSLLAAATSRFDLLAAGEIPWYKTARQEKVKVTVDMPWGVAAIRGSFWQNIVNNDGSGFMSQLEGNGSVTSGGQTVNLSPGQATAGSGAGAPPTPPAPMTPSQLSQWAQQQSWVENTFNNMSQNQGSPAPGAPAGSGAAGSSGAAQSLEQSLNQALGQARQAAASIPGSSGGGGGSNGGNGGSGQITAAIDNMPGTIYLPLQVMNPETGRLEDNADGVSLTLTCDVPGVTVGMTDYDGNPASQDSFTYRSSQTGNQITLTLTPNAVGNSYVYITLSKTGYTSWTSENWFTVAVLPVVEPLNPYAAEGYNGTLTVGIPGNWLTDSPLRNSGGADISGEYVAHVSQSGSSCLNVTINPGLPAGIYYIMLQDSSYSRFAAPFLIRPASSAGNFFTLENAVMNRDNETVYGSVYQGDSLSFIFEEGIDEDFLSEPLRDLLTATGASGVAFDELGLGKFVASFISSEDYRQFGQQYEFDDAVPVTKASLSADKKVLTLAFTRGAFDFQDNQLATQGEYKFMAAGSLRSTGGDWMQSEPVTSALFKVVNDDTFFSTFVEGYTNKNISSMKVRFWGSPGWDGAGPPDEVYYLQDDGNWGSDMEEFTAAIRNVGSCYKWEVTVPYSASVPTGIDYIYCDVQMDGEWLYNVGQLEVFTP